MKLKLLAFSVIVFTLIACNNDDDRGTTDCDLSTIISPNDFKNAASDPLQINYLEIQGDCLKINFSSGGCDGTTWEIKLIDSGAILETSIPQRNLWLSLKNTEECMAVITKEMTFDISNLKVEGNQVRLNITNSEEHILYKY